MSRVKVFELSKNVEVVAVKGLSENESPSIMVSFYTEHENEYYSFGFESIHKSDVERDKNFDEDHTAQLIRIFNKIVTESEYPLDLIPELPTEEIEVKEPQTLK